MQIVAFSSFQRELFQMSEILPTEKTMKHFENISQRFARRLKPIHFPKFSTTIFPYSLLICSFHWREQEQVLPNGNSPVTTFDAPLFLSSEMKQFRFVVNFLTYLSFVVKRTKIFFENFFRRAVDRVTTDIENRRNVSSICMVTVETPRSQNSGASDPIPKTNQINFEERFTSSEIDLRADSEKSRTVREENFRSSLFNGYSTTENDQWEICRIVFFSSTFLRSKWKHRSEMESKVN